MIKEILADQSKKMLVPCSNHYLVSVSFAWKQLLKQQNNHALVQRPAHRLK